MPDKKYQPPILSLQNATAHYDQQTVLREINLQLFPGEKVVLLGKSGAGKTSLLQLFHQQLADAHQNFSWVPQHLGLVPNLSVFHNIFIGQLNQSSVFHNLLNLLWPQAKPKTDISNILERLGLPEKLFTMTTHLSGGQQQRVAIARAIYTGNGLIIADEPIANLDKPMANQVLAQLSQHFDSIVLTLHDTELALRFADRIIGIKNGTIAVDRPAAELSQHELEQLY